MADGFKRINSDDVTETLMAAMEHDDDIETVLVLYQTKKGSDHYGGYHCPADTESSTLLWMIEGFKWWLMSACDESKGK